MRILGAIEFGPPLPCGADHAPAEQALKLMLPAPPGGVCHVPSAFLSGTPSNVFSVPISTRINPSGVLHKRFQLRWGDLTSGDVPQCSRPFADRLVIDIVIRRATNDAAKRICILDDRKICELKRMPQRCLRFPPHLVVRDYFEHGF
jgi:hypothetical protein